ncbi:MAG: ROK family protein [Bacteroidota bacterium]
MSNLVRQLMSSGMIIEAERRQEGRGAPSTTLTLNADGAFAIGLDLDRDHLTGVLVDLSGTVRERISEELDFPSPEDALSRMASLTEELIARQKIDRQRIWGVGVGIPGPMHRLNGSDSYVMNPKAFPGWRNVPVGDYLEDRLGLPVFLENNATAAAVGERWYGTGKDYRTFFYIYFGSGLGGGLILQGQPYEGSTGNAGEIGYMPDGAPTVTRVEDRPHVGLHFYLPELFERLRASGEDVRSPADLEPLLDERHPLLIDWINKGADHLTNLALAVEYLVDPEAMFFGGRLPNAIIKEVMTHVADLLPKRRIGGKEAATPHLMATAGVDAAALGVATLPFYEFSAPAPRVLMKQNEGGGSVSINAPRAPRLR